MNRAILNKQMSWVKLLGKFISIQLLVQCTGFASGILLIRSLSKQEYAFFILANALQGSMNVLANSGITSALSAIGGNVWQDRNRFGELINTAMKWRRCLALVSIVVVVPIMLQLLSVNGASLGYALILTLGILIELHFYLRTGVFQVVPRLQSKALSLQKIELMSGISRMAILFPALNLYSNAAIGIFSSAFASGVKDFYLSRWVNKAVNLNAPTNTNDHKEIVGFVKNQSLYTIFYCIQGPLTIFLIGLFGNVESVAEVGAIGRLGVIFAVITSVASNLISPSFSRTFCKQEIVKKYALVITFYLSMLIFIMPLSVVFSEQIIWILGAKYGALSNYVTLAIAASVLNSLIGTLWTINVSKGWVKGSWAFIPATITTQIFALFYCDISSISGILIFNLISLVPSVFLNIYLSYCGWTQISKASI
ncbi:MAG: hypothetical protein ACFB16_26640 [Phormidesmis sp.]